VGVILTGLALLASVTSVSAQGGCALTVDGQPAPLNGTAADPIVLSATGRVEIAGNSPAEGDPYRVWIEAYGLQVELAQGNAQATWSADVDLSQYAWLGSGVYEVVGQTSGAEPCTGVVYVRLGETASLLTVAGAIGIGLSILGVLLVLRSLGGSLPRRSLTVIGARVASSGESDDVGSPASALPASVGPVIDPSDVRRLESLTALSERASGAGPTMAVAIDEVPAPKSIVSVPVEPGTKPTGYDAYELLLDVPMGAQERARLEKAGVKIVGFVPPSTYRTLLTPAQVADVRVLPFVRQIRRYGLDQTVPPDTLDRITGSDGSDTDEFDCLLHRPSDLEFLRSFVERADGLDVVDAGYDALRLSAPPNSRSLAAIAALPQVRRVLLYRPPDFQADHSRRLIGIEAAAMARPGAPKGWTGAGQIVAMIDSGVDESHPDLAGQFDLVTKVGDAPAKDEYGHGTHVAGIIAGRGIASGGAIRGMAPDARLVSVGVRLPTGKLAIGVDPGTVLAIGLERGAKIINLSLGTPIGGDYDAGSRAIDRFVWEHPDVLVVVAAGNRGAADHGQIRFKTVYTPATAKNVLTVGASQTDRPEFVAKLWGTFRP